jgi:Skp family chaperone for outer membrane proteins
LLTLLSGCNEEKQPQKPVPQFGVVQLSKLYQESQIGKQGIARVGELEGKAMALLKDLQDQLEKARKAGNEEEAGKLEKDLQARVYFLQNVIKQDQEHVMNVIQTALTKAFNQYSAEHQLFGVFSSETMLSSSPEADVTAAVQSILDKENTNFGDLPSLEMPKLPEPTNAGADNTTDKETGSAETPSK